MTDNEIKKALECCANLEACEKCPMADMQKYDTDTCEHQIMLYALDLLNRQQAEIERLKDENLQSEYPARIRVDDFFVCANSLGEWLEFCDSLKAEAIKEFAERLKEKAEYHENGEGWEGDICYVDDIDNLVKEMVGDAE